MSSYYAPLLGQGALRDDARLTSVCRVHRAYVENREAYRKTKIGTEVAHVTSDSDTTFKVKIVCLFAWGLTALSA